MASVALLASGCGLPEIDFVEEYTAKVCQHELACGDQAQLRFDGVLDEEDCAELTRPSVYAWGDGCRYRGAQATQCVADLDTRTCPGQGGLAPIPASCEQVYVNCSDVPDGDGGGTDTGSGGEDTGSDPGTGGDTDAGGSDTDA